MRADLVGDRVELPAEDLVHDLERAEAAHEDHVVPRRSVPLDVRLRHVVQVGIVREWGEDDDMRRLRPRHAQRCKFPAGQVSEVRMRGAPEQGQTSSQVAARSAELLSEENCLTWLSGCP
jgi:hypothetical protein